MIMKKLFKLFSLLLAVVCTFALTACTPKDMDAAKEKLEKAGYTVVVYENYFIAKTALVNGETVTGYLFESKEKAEESYERIKKIDANAVLSGKWIYYGTEQGMKDFD